MLVINASRLLVCSYEIQIYLKDLFIPFKVGDLVFTSN